MIQKNEFLEKGFTEVSEDKYSITLMVNQINFTGNPVETSFILVMEVDNIEENELGTYIVTRFNERIIRTGYYTSITDLLNEIRI